MDPLALSLILVQLAESGILAGTGLLAVPIAVALGIAFLLILFPHPYQTLHQAWSERFGHSVTVYHGQKTMYYILLQLKRGSWPSATVESAMGQLPGSTTNYLPGEGTSVFYHKGEMLHIQRKNIHTPSERLTVRGITRRAAQVFVEYCQRQGERGEGIPHWIWSPENGHGAWVKSEPHRPARMLKSIILPEGTKERITDDLALFNSQQQRKYDAALGNIHKRTYIFHGASGTGKNSCAEAIAGELHWDVYTIPCADTSITDAEFAFLFSKVDPPCVVVLDELHNAFERIRRAHGQGGMSSCVVNGFLDGPFSRSNIVTVLLAKNLDGFPEDLRRDGRVHETFYLTKTTKTMARDLFFTYFTTRYDLDGDAIHDRGDIGIHAQEFAEQIEDAIYTPATVSTYLQKYSDPRMAVAEIYCLKNTHVSSTTDQHTLPVDYHREWG
ncbi:MAG: hypothetical protein Q9168_001732 [Polycauliona sp. 1 TL-2023]